MPVSTTYETQIQNIAKNKQAKLVIKSMLRNKEVQIPAFLTSFTQTFASTWNEEDVYGRMDPIATFQNTKRSISLGFDLPAGTQKTAKHNLKQCDLLAQFLYPGYKEQPEQGKSPKIESQVISRPPLVSVKFANLISSGGGGQLGYLSGLEWTPVLEMGMFANGKSLYPKVISLSFTLNVLHQATKGLNENNTWISGSATFFGN